MAASHQIIGKSVCYVVAVVIIENNKILMVQEAKKSCHGKWYLPAGRVERGETFDQAAVREAQEESGLLIDTEALTLVELQGCSWMRFTFTGRVVGGGLKEKPDKESLKAEWLKLELVLAGGSKEYPLRSYDIAPNIHATKKFLESSTRPGGFLPSHVSHRHTEIALLLTRRTRDGKEEFLTNSVDCDVPYSVLTFRSIFATLRDMFAAVFPGKPGLTADRLSVAEVQFSGGGTGSRHTTDGCRLVFTADVTDEPSDPAGLHHWIEADLMTHRMPGTAWMTRLQTARCVPVHFL